MLFQCAIQIKSWVNHLYCWIFSLISFCDCSIVKSHCFFFNIILDDSSRAVDRNQFGLVLCMVNVLECSMRSLCAWHTIYVLGKISFFSRPFELKSLNCWILFSCFCYICCLLRSFLFALNHRYIGWLLCWPLWSVFFPSKTWINNVEFLSSKSLINAKIFSILSPLITVLLFKSHD